MTYLVRFAPEAAGQLAALFRYLSAAVSPQVADGYVDAIVAYCEGLAVFPHRGMMRDDTRPGLRALSYKKRVVIAIQVNEAAEHVNILGVFYGSQDYETLLSAPNDGG